MTRVRRSIAGLGLASALACSGPSGEQTHFIPAPSRESFPPVSDVLHANCGSLDCHGTLGRSLRIYGMNGLRIGGVSGAAFLEGEKAMIDDANYQSVVMLEPEKFGRVVLDGGRDPGRLTLLRKARGAEHHKGGAPMPQGSAGDRCLVSWLAQAVDADACLEAAELTGPEWPE